MALLSAPLRREITRVLPERPFHIHLWDGTAIPATIADAPTFNVRAPSAVAHVLRAPSRLGLGRGYVESSLDADDLDAAFRTIDSWEAPRIDSRQRVPLPVAATAGAATA